MTVRLVLIISSYIAYSFKVAYVGYCALQSYCLVVAQAKRCSGFRMQKCHCPNLYPKDNEIGFPNTFLVDRAKELLKTCSKPATWGSQPFFPLKPKSLRPLGMGDRCKTRLTLERTRKFIPPQWYVVWGGGGWNPSPEFLICCGIL